eukprot:6287138-Prymnesium_polylepis.1
MGLQAGERDVHAVEGLRDARAEGVRQPARDEAADHGPERVAQQVERQRRHRRLQQRCEGVAPQQAADALDELRQRL